MTVAPLPPSPATYVADLPPGHWHGRLWVSHDPISDPRDYLDRVADYPASGRWPVLVPANWPGQAASLPKVAGPDGWVGAAPAQRAQDPQAEAAIAGAAIISSGISSGRPGYHLGLVEAARPADVPARLGFGGARNAETLSAVLRGWEHRFGSILVVLGQDELVVSVSAPPTTLQLALVVAAEHRAFCPNVRDRFPGSLPQHAKGLIRGRRWHFRWD